MLCFRTTLHNISTLQHFSCSEIEIKITFVASSCGKATADFRENDKGLLINDEGLITYLLSQYFP